MGGGIDTWVKHMQKFLQDVPCYKERPVIKSKVPLQIGKEGPWIGFNSQWTQTKEATTINSGLKSLPQFVLLIYSFDT